RPLQRPRNRRDRLLRCRRRWYQGRSRRRENRRLLHGERGPMTSLTFGGGYGNARNATAVWRGWDRFDYVMLVAAGALVIYGLLLIYSGSLPWYEGPIVSLNNPAAKQAIFAAVGIVGMLIVSKIDYHYFIHYSWAFYI